MTYLRRVGFAAAGFGLIVGALTLDWSTIYMASLAIYLLNKQR